MGEAENSDAPPLRLQVERGRFGRIHVGAKSAQPNEARRPGPHWRAAAKGDTPLIRGAPQNEKLRLFVRQIQFAPMMRPTDRASTCSRLDAGHPGGLAERAAAVNRAIAAALPSSRRSAA